jgi:hypothetical protein
MGLFGWNLPPGVTYLPGEQPEGPCEVCGQFNDKCLCPECPVCGEFGNPACYVDHGLNVTREQEAAKEAAEKAQADLVAAEEEFWRNYKPE